MVEDRNGQICIRQFQTGRISVKLEPTQTPPWGYYFVVDVGLHNITYIHTYIHTYEPTIL